tara:strand:- start:1348 stop:1539 length:192 start_codon:yes stop_codon:yes gene_type:complete
MSSTAYGILASISAIGCLITFAGGVVGLIGSAAVLFSNGLSVSIFIKENCPKKPSQTETEELE